MTSKQRTNMAFNDGCQIQLFDRDADNLEQDTNAPNAKDKTDHDDNRNSPHNISPSIDDVTKYGGSDEDDDSETSYSDSSENIELDLADVIDSCSLLDGELIEMSSLSFSDGASFDGEPCRESDSSTESDDDCGFPITTSFCRIVSPNDVPIPTTNTHQIPNSPNSNSKEQRFHPDQQRPHDRSSSSKALQLDSEIMLDLYKQLCEKNGKPEAQTKLKNESVLISQDKHNEDQKCLERVKSQTKTGKKNKSTSLSRKQKQTKKAHSSFLQVRRDRSASPQNEHVGGPPSPTDSTFPTPFAKRGSLRSSFARYFGAKEIKKRFSFRSSSRSGLIHTKELQLESHKNSHFATNVKSTKDNSNRTQFEASKVIKPEAKLTRDKENCSEIDNDVILAKKNSNELHPRQARRICQTTEDSINRIPEIKDNKRNCENLIDEFLKDSCSSDENYMPTEMNNVKSENQNLTQEKNNSILSKSNPVLNTEKQILDSNNVDGTNNSTLDTNNLKQLSAGASISRIFRKNDVDDKLLGNRQESSDNLNDIQHKNSEHIKLRKKQRKFESSDENPTQTRLFPGHGIRSLPPDFALGKIRTLDCEFLAPIYSGMTPNCETKFNDITPSITPAGQAKLMMALKQKSTESLKITSPSSSSTSSVRMVEEPLKDNAQDTGFESEASSDLSSNSSKERDETAIGIELLEKSFVEPDSKQQTLQSDSEISPLQQVRYEIGPVSASNSRKHLADGAQSKIFTSLNENGDFPCEPVHSAPEIAKTESKSLLDAYDDELLARLLTNPTKQMMHKRATSTSQRRSVDKLPCKATDESSQLTPNKEKPNSSQQPHVKVTLERRGRPSFKKLSNDTSGNSPEHMYHSSRKELNKPDPPELPHPFDPFQRPAFHRPLLHNPFQENLFHPSPVFPLPRSPFNIFHQQHSMLRESTAPMMQPLTPPTMFNYPPRLRIPPRFESPNLTSPHYTRPHFASSSQLNHGFGRPAMRQRYAQVRPHHEEPNVMYRARSERENPGSMRDWLQEIDESCNRLIADCDDFNFQESNERDNYNNMLERNYYDENREQSQSYFNRKSRSQGNGRPSRPSFEQCDVIDPNGFPQANPSRSLVKRNSFTLDEDRESYSNFMANFARELRDPRLCLREQNFRCLVISEMQRLLPLVRWRDMAQFYDNIMNHYYRISAMHMTAEEKEQECGRLLDSMVEEILSSQNQPVSV